MLDVLNHFFKDFSLVKTNSGYINSSKSTDFIDKYAEKTSLPLNHLNISEAKLKKDTKLQIVEIVSFYL